MTGIIANRDRYNKTKLTRLAFLKVIVMSEVFNMDLANILEADSEFVEGLRDLLVEAGIEIDCDSLSVILHEYEISKLDFLKAQILKVLEGEGRDISDIDLEALSVIVPSSGSASALESEGDQEEEPLDTKVIS